jgi:CBS domain-containing protein
MPLDHAAGLSAADVIHKQFSALPADATVGDVRQWFAASAHRQMAVLAQDGRYAGSITRADADGAGTDDRPASEIARSGPTIEPGAPAHEGHQLALSTGARRVPVVDSDGRLLGVVGVTDDLAAFCGAA